MADTKISSLSSGTPLVAADALIIARAGANYRVAPFPQVVTSLPGSPANGDECYYKQGSGDTAVFWHLKYDSSVSDAYKWRFLGGPGLIAHVAGADAVGAMTANVWSVFPTTAGPSVTVPLAGVYHVRIHASFQTSAARTFSVYVGVRVGSTDPAATTDWLRYVQDEASVTSTNQIHYSGAGREREITAAASDSLQMIAQRQAGSGDVTLRTIFAIPVRLG